VRTTLDFELVTWAGRYTEFFGEGHDAVGVHNIQ